MWRIFAGSMFLVLSVLPALAGSFDDFNQGINANNRGDSAAAINAFSRALESGELSKSLTPVALLDRGIAFERQKRYEDAIADLNAALALNPGKYDAIYWRMLAYAWNAQGGLASADCDSLLRARPMVAALYSQCALMRWVNGEYAQAARYFETAVGLRPKRLASDILWLELSRLRAGTPDEAQFAQYSKELELDGWPAPIFELYLGKRTPEAVLAAAENRSRPFSVPGFLHFQSESAPPTTQTASLQLQRCESAFFVGEWQLVHQNSTIAKSLLRETETYCNGWLPAQTELDRLTPK